MSHHIISRLVVAVLIVGAPIVSIGACGGSNDDSASDVQDDAATGDAPPVADAAIEAALRDASTSDARVDADAAKTLNRCGGYSELELGGHAVTPGDSCGVCNDGTIACVGSNVVECAGASSAPCPPVDASPNACGGYGSLTFLSASASIGDACGGCGQLQCASRISLVCGSSTSCTVDAGPAPTCTIASAAYTATTASPTLPPETRPSVTSTTAIALPATDLAFNPYDGFLYASISNDVTQGNSIAKIDPMSATVLGTVYVGASPTHIALSDDGKALWVVVTSPLSIGRVDLTTFTVGAAFALPYTNVLNIEVLAGTEDSLAVTTYQYFQPFGATSYSVIIYDSGVARAYAAPIEQSTATVGTASASLLFAGGIYHSPFDIATLCIDGDGVFVTGSTVPSASDVTTIFSNGVLYGTDGSAYNAQSGTLLHTFPAGYQALVTLDGANVYFLTSTAAGLGESVQVTGYDRATYAVTTTDLLATNGPGLQNFIRWGRYGFAYIESYEGIDIARSTIIPDMP
jgi:hypothetical protein